VLGWASSPEPVELGLDKGLQWAWAWLQISEAQVQGSSPGFDTSWSSMQLCNKKGNIKTINA